MKQPKILQWILYTGLGIILFILPYPRGLFFAKEIVPVQIACFLLFILWSGLKIVKKEKIEIDSFLMTSVILLPVVYTLPLLFGVAASYYGALTYIFRYLTYMVIFLILSDLTKTKKEAFLWLNILGISGILAAILGIDAGLGSGLNNYFRFNGVIDEYGRVRGVLQYSNSFGAYMGIIFFILVGLSLLTEKKYLKAFYSACQVLPLMALLMTVSRGAIVFVPLIYLLLILFVPTKEKKLEVILSTIAPIIIALFAGKMLTEMVHPILKGEGEGLVQRGWMIAFIAIVAAYILSFILTGALGMFSRVSTKVYQIGIAFAGVIAVLGGIVLFTSGLYRKLLPEFLLQRFSQIGSVTELTSGRSNFYRDGLRMLKDKWLLGGGGNAWAAMYRKYQSYFYGSSEAHSLPLQLWLETGILGMMVLAFFIVSLFIVYFKNRKSEDGVELTVLLIPVLMLLSHSIIDFNFSYVSLPLMSFALIGAMAGLKKRGDLNFTISSWIPLALGVIFIAFPISWQISRNYAVKATAIIRKEDANANDVLDAVEYMEKAVDLNGWNADYMLREGDPQDGDLLYDLSTLYGYLYDIVEQNDPEQIGLVEQKQTALYEKVYKLEPYNPYISMQYAQTLFQKGEIEQGLAVVENAKNLNPMYEGRYQELAQAYFAVAEYYIGQGDQEAAKPYLERVIEVEKELEEINKIALEKVNMTEKTKEYIEKAKELL
ncbi:MAG: hypothetical protein PWP07_177 [Epulopiscium sp.]|jgi:hypothetical protein|nr:NrfG [Defluviitaleaceae bacterium]MDK2786952.1 hypothetical protein [Candidatus Epulonipiscium sp.]HHW67478.1 hypothetical protein [Candidatus Epulonipiscium sp.]